MDDRAQGELARQLEEISRRLDRVERRIGIVPETRAQSTQAAVRSLDDRTRDAFKAWKAAQKTVEMPFANASPDGTTSPAEAPAIIPSDSTRVNAPVRDDETVAEAPPMVHASSPEAAVPPRAAPPTSPPVRPVSAGSSALDSAFDTARIARERARAAIAERKRSSSGGLQSLESMIGGRWYAIVGAIIVVIGVGLFFKLAIQNHWLVLPPAWRCVGGAMFGVLLLVGGEVARRKINSITSVGLSAAGLGVMYAAAFAAYRVFDLVHPVAAFPMLVAVVLLGIGISARAKLASIACISLVGGYLTPLLFLNVPPTPGVLPSYLLTLMAIGFTLPAWRGSAFVWTRHIAWWGTIAGGGAWVYFEGGDTPAIAACFVGAVWAGVHLAMALEARRFGFGGERPAARSTREMLSRAAKASLAMEDFLAWRPLASSFSTTSWTALLGVNLVRHWGAFPEWLVPGAIAFPAMGLAFVLAGNLRVLRDEPEDDAQRLGACLAVQSGALVIEATALGLSGSVRVLAWLAMGVAVVTAARWLRSRGLDVYGLIVLSLAAVRVAVFERFGPLVAAPADLLGLKLTLWSAVTAGVGVGWLASAWMLRRSAPEGTRWRAIAHTAFGVGATLVFGALFDHRMAAEAGAVVALTMALTIATLGRVLGSTGLWAYALCVLTVGSLFPVLKNWTEAPGGAVGFAGVRVTLWSAVAAYGGIAWIVGGGMAYRSASEHVRRFGLPAFCAGVTLVLTALLHQGMRAESGAVIGVLLALIVTGIAVFSRSGPVWMYAAFVLLAGTAFMPTQAWWRASATNPGVDLLGLRLTVWTGVIAFAGAAWISIGLLLRRVPLGSVRGSGVAFAAIGLFLIMVSLVHESASYQSVCLVWLGLLGIASVAGRFEKTLMLDRLAVVGSVLPVIAWIVAYEPLDGWHSAASAPGLYPGLWVGLAVAGAAVAMARPLRPSGRDDRSAPALRVLGWAIALLMVFAATSLEIGRSAEKVFSDQTVQRAAVSVWWGVFAFAMIATGFWVRWSKDGPRGVARIRQVGLGLLAVAALKALIVDLNDVPPLGRVVSFIGLGLLMLAVAVTYGKVSKRLAAPEADEPTPRDAAEPEPPLDGFSGPKSTST